MSLAPGTTIGPYTIDAAIGAGGMGEVYRATDTRLGRKVAIKVLPDEVAADPDRLARFEREARALAALNHFNVAQVYGFEGRALVMELLEGETLRERLAAGALPVRKAVEYGLQIARGLAAAHDRGIIHRDLKPENIFIVNDGHIKILDFGLARRAEDAGATETQTAGTAPGMVLGTVGYMAPEQVRGQVVDARGDLFSLGAVLYEMLTGARAFRRDSSADTMAAILNEHPRDVAAQRPEAGPSLDRIVQHCLEKNPVERFQSARDVAFALDSLSGSATAAPADAVTTARAFPIERAAWALITTMLIAVLAWTSTRDRATAVPTAPVARGLITLPEGVIVNDITPHGSRLSTSPDGRYVVFTGRHLNTGQSQVFVQPLDGSAAIPIPQSQAVASTFWSHDSKSVLLVSPSAMHRAALDGSPPILLGNLTPGVIGGSVNADGDILVGGTAIRQWQPRTSSLEVLFERPGQRFPNADFLPDGRRFLFARIDAAGQLSIEASRLGATESTMVISGGGIGDAQYANDAVVFSRGDMVFAQRAAGDPLTLTGEPVVLAQSVAALSGRGAAMSASANGVLVYQAIESQPAFRLTWVDRAGTVVSTIGDADDYSNIELSNDGRRLLASISDPRIQARDIFIIDVTRGVRQRFTSHASDERSAIWSPDDRRVVYTSKGLNLYERNADSSGAERAINSDGVSKDPYDWSPDGKSILYRRTGPGNTNDLWIGPADGSSPGRAIVDTPASDLSGNFSPDGRRILYTSDETGRPEVYLIDISGGGKTQISSSGGLFPRWRGDGQEIFYLTIERELMSAPVRTEPVFEVGAARPLFRMNVTSRPGPPYDVSRDGQRFIVASPVPSRVPPSLTVLTNWPALLERK